MPDTNHQGHVGQVRASHQSVRVIRHADEAQSFCASSTRPKVCARPFLQFSRLALPAPLAETRSYVLRRRPWCAR